MIASRHTTREKSSKFVLGLGAAFLFNLGAFSGSLSRAEDPKLYVRGRDEPRLTRANDGDRSGPETGVITCPISGPANCQSPDQMRHGFSLIFLSVSDTNPQAGLITADTLQVAANGSISQVCWWGAYGDAAGTNDCGPGTGDAFTVTYYDNDLGQFPGSLRAGPFALTNVAKALTGASYGGQIMEWQFSATHPPVSVTAGECLWIEIANDTTGSCLWLWSAAPPGDGFAAQDFDLDGYDFVDTVDYDLAWCVNVAVEPEACVPPAACGSPETGNCLTANRTPSCDDLDCCTAVCEMDSFCCSVAWDSICADAAAPLSQCGGCPHSLVLTDSGNDGWEGASLDVMVNGNPVLDGAALLAGQSMGTFTFNAHDGDAISTVYNPGTANSENGYAIRDSTGQLIAQDLPPPEAGGLQASGVCVALNDTCNDALGIVDGLTPFLTIGTTTDGPDYLGNPSCGGSDDQLYNDVWYEYNATCNGSLIVSTCEDLGAFATFDTRVSIHQGCAGAPGQCTTGPVLGCNDDDLDNDCGFNLQSTLVVPATAGTCYRIRVGGFSDLDEGVGELFVNCATCLTLADCADPNSDGIRDDPCMWWTCEAGDCLGTLRDPGQGNMGGQFGDCTIDGVCEGSDIFHAINCFSDVSTLGVPGYPCEPNPPFALNVDAAGLFGSCALDGACDLNDVFAAQLCFSDLGPTGLPPYPCTCSGPGPQPPAPRGGPAQPAPVDWTPISLTAPAAARPGELVEVDLFLDRALQDLRGYQLHVGTRGGATGQLQLVEMAIHDQRQDFAFRERPYWSAFNLETAQMIAGLHIMGVPTAGRAYLATFTFRVSDEADGTFLVDVLYDDHRAIPTERTFLFASPLQKIAVDGSLAARIAVIGGKKTGVR